MLDSLPNQLLNTLEDIVHNIEIQSNFCITYPNYPPLELPSEIVESFQQLPLEKLSLEIQNNYLSLQLRNFLYEIYFSGEQQANLEIDLNLDRQDLDNNTVGGLNVEFYEKLQKSNCGEGYFDRDWRVLIEESDDTLAVKKNNLTLYIDRNYHLQLADRSARVGDIVSILMPSNLMDDGCYVAVGNAGQIYSSIAVEIYFNSIANGAIALMKTITQQLNAIAIPFTFKVLYNPSDYDRYDSGILKFDRNNYETVRPILEAVYQENKNYFQPSTPLFTKFLAPGLSLAESPNDQEIEQTSFGKNRCQIVANALLEAWQKGDNSPENRMRSIRKHFSEHGIEFYRPHLNPNSEDIYNFTKDFCKGEWPFAPT